MIGTQDLKALRDDLFRADFKAAWDGVATLSLDGMPDGSDMQDPGISEALRFRSMAAEVCDYWGKYARAKQFVAMTGEFCETSLRSLNLANRIGEKEKRKVVQQVWVALQAGLCEYRATRLDSAFSLFTICDQVLSSHGMASAKDPRWGTKARIQYSLGLVYRERYELQKAIGCFTASTELAYRSFVHNSAAGKTEMSKLNDIAIARSIGMGLASVYNAMGRPDLAVPLLMAAKAMLPPEEKLISTHIDLIEATLLRGSPQIEEAMNGSVLGRLLDCLAIFKSYGHALYRARCTYSLAREYTRRVRSDPSKPQLTREDGEFLRSAEKFLKELDFQTPGNSHFRHYALLLQCEIERKKGDFATAEEHASSALQDVGASRLPSLFIELCLARGLARMAKGSFKRAIQDFSAGLKVAENAKNRRLHATFLLHLCQCYARKGEDLEAARCLSRFEEVEAFMEVETSDVQQLSDETRAAFRRAPDLVLTINDNFDPNEMEKRFRRFLIEWARTKSSSKNNVDVANTLKISRQTLYNWMKEANS